MRRLALPILACLAVLPAHAQQASTNEPLQGRPPTSASSLVVDMRDASGKSIGTVELRQLAHGMLLVASLSNLPPGPHGFHIHERGICEPPGFQSAGGHLDPTGGGHGLDVAAGPHLGDLTNIHADERGNARAEYFVPRLTLARGGAPGTPAASGPVSLLDGDGSAIVVHERADDYRDNDSAGGRIACGAIRAQ